MSDNFDNCNISSEDSFSDCSELKSSSDDEELRENLRDILEDWETIEDDLSIIVSVLKIIFIVLAMAFIFYLKDDKIEIPDWVQGTEIQKQGE